MTKSAYKRFGAHHLTSKGMDMNKQEEIGLLDKMIAEFGSDSYIGPWLQNERVAIVHAIENDLLVDISVADARGQADGILLDARVEGQHLVDAAQKEADELRRKAKGELTDAEAAKEYARRQLIEIAERLRKGW